MKKYLIVYHKEDNDGVFSAALAYNFIRYKLNIPTEEIDTFGTEYNELNHKWVYCKFIDWTENYESIIMTDISVNDAVGMKYLYNKLGCKFIWVDHHAPAIKESIKQKYEDCKGWRDTSRSAILNMYRYLYDTLDIAYTNGDAPELLRILSAWDSFSYKREGYELDYVNKVNLGINFMYNLDLNSITALLSNLVPIEELSDKQANLSYINSALTYGEIIAKNKEQEYSNLVKNFGDYSWNVGGRTACALFIQGPSTSQMFVSANVQNGIVFKRQKDGKWVISLYNVDNNDDFNCGEYLKRNYKGGGHTGAAGCTISERQFRRILNTHQL